jgi:mRNA interferase HicA
MKSSEFAKWLKKQGCEIIQNEPKGGHITVKYNGRKTVMPFHGSRQELKKGKMEAIKKQLGLK